ncbi:PIN domain-containing protein [Brachybacterium muris]|uniref:PIN domain-containing protein n=1 Tax=Brachybacterium muris TaxID=219301 RepID=UPI00223B47E1|nr:PIN domain-containing protein [Brachybacterium muris]MCT1431197.1 PIN domain-containing protein [Brachybacterium muris]MCT1654783.1 PIN domain-containing protein [Brachybacterium muris]MCT2177306.1 PIN domain-containing protein [Brachybacterium muris]MCT2295113.1 PIN domain-containing protein [Brachybacterium muris]
MGQHRPDHGRSPSTVWNRSSSVLRRCTSLSAPCRGDPSNGRTRRSTLLAALRPIATTAARLHAPGPLPHDDALIAATAKAHGLVLVTRNTKDFRRTGVRLMDPWEM